MNFIVSMPGKLHCTFERVTNCAGKARSLVLEASLLLRKVMIMGQLGRNYPRVLQKLRHKFLEYFGLFLTRTLTSQIFSFGLPEIILCVLTKTKTTTEITCKSYVKINNVTDLLSFHFNEANFNYGRSKMRSLLIASQGSRKS